LLRLLVEARILERDRGLGGEVAERSELLLAERVGRLAEPEHADDAEQPVADDQRLDDRVPSADADELRLGIRRCGIVVDEAALPLEGAGADETDAEGDALIDRGALAPGARCQRVARGLHQVDRALGPGGTTGRRSRMARPLAPVPRAKTIRLNRAPTSPETAIASTSPVSGSSR